MTGPTPREKTSQEEPKVQLDARLVERVGEMTVLNEDGHEYRFQDLIDAKDGEKRLLLFIRCVIYLFYPILLAEIL